MVAMSQEPKPPPIPPPLGRERLSNRVGASPGVRAAMVCGGSVAGATGSRGSTPIWGGERG